MIAYQRIRDSASLRLGHVLLISSWLSLSKKEHASGSDLIRAHKVDDKASLKWSDVDSYATTSRLWGHRKT